MTGQGYARVMLTARKAGTMFIGVWVGAGIVTVLLNDVLDFDGGWVLWAILAGGLFGGVLSLGEARVLRPMPPAERRDAIQGWGFVVALVLVLACLAIPMPWGAIAAPVVLVVWVLAVRRVAVRGQARTDQAVSRARTM